MEGSWIRFLCRSSAFREAALERDRLAEECTPKECTSTDSTCSTEGKFNRAEYMADYRAHVLPSVEHEETVDVTCFGDSSVKRIVAEKGRLEG